MKVYFEACNTKYKKQTILYTAWFKWNNYEWSYNLFHISGVTYGFSWLLLEGSGYQFLPLLAWVSFTSVLLFKALLKIVITVLLQKVGFTAHFSVNTGLLFPLQSSQSSASRGESVCAVAPHPDHHGGGGVCWPAQWEDKGLFHTGAVSTQGCHTAHEDQWKEPNQAALRRAIWPYWRQPDRAVSPGFWWMSRLPMLINLTVPINLAYS